VLVDALFLDQRTRIVELAARRRLPSLFGLIDFVEAGGLMSYGANDIERFRRVASFVDRILKGAKPGDLPVEQPTKFELVINLKTAKALGLTIPQSLLIRADQVIESGMPDQRGQLPSFARLLPAVLNRGGCPCS